jgi:glycosyltransferase involved in cell wall biosynthesis
MDDLRWFAPNRYCALPVPALRRAGLRVALEGIEPARLAVASDGQCAVAAFEFARRCRCPLVLYVWDLPPWRLDGGRPDFIYEMGKRLARLPRLWGGYPERSGYYSRIRYVARHAEAVWCPSTNSVRDVLRYYGVRAERIPFCYDSDRFRTEVQSPFTVHRSPFTVLSVSRLVPHKNHAIILQATAQLEPRPAVRILGEGPEADTLRRLAASLGVALELPGTWASDAEILDAYRTAGVVVAPSRFEGFGLTPLEGMAMGVPVIASDVPPHREFLNGAVRFFPPDDAPALAREIGSLMARPSQRPTAPPPLLSDLSIDSCATRLLAGIRRMLAGAA